jgi:uncharacterized protein YceK
MKRIVVLLVVMALAGLSGCATKEYVRSQVNPLAERIDKLEAAAKASSMVDTEQATAIKQADNKAQLALDTANKASGEAQNARQDAQNALQGAQKAEAAAKEAAKEAAMSAEDAKQTVKKSEKIFNLQQKK